MAIKQAGTLKTDSGNFKLSIIRQDLAEEFFNTADDQYNIFQYRSGVGYTHLDQYYVVKGDTLNSALVQTSSITKKANLFTVNGNTFVANVGNNIINEGILSNGAYLSRRPVSIYIRDNEAVEHAFAGTEPSFGLKLITSDGREYVLPVYLTIIFDDEKEEAMMVTSSYYSIDNYYAPTFSFSFFKLHDTFMNRTKYTKKEVYKLLNGKIPEFSTDPWSEAGFADIGGGKGELDLTSDIIGLPELPQSITSTGFIQLYTPTIKQINELSDYMWGDGFLDNVLKLWNDPMDIIINLAQFPFTIPSAGIQTVMAGNVVTNVEMNYPSSQYMMVDCGTVDVHPFYNAYIDYEPYTTCEIFLPYIGYQAISMDEIMGKRLHVVYRIDLVTGVCCAYILCDECVMYTFAGTCSANIPVSGQTFQAMAQSLINVATAGVSSALKDKGNAASSMLASSGQAIMSMKPGVSRSGSVSANVGILGPQKPYLVYTIPRTCLPKNQDKLLGYPAYITYKLSDLKGFTVIDEIILKNCTCTEEEKSEIDMLLKGGVIL